MGRPLLKTRAPKSQCLIRRFTQFLQRATPTPDVLSAQLQMFILILASGASGRTFWVNLALISLFIQWAALGNILLLCSADSSLSA